MTSLLTVVAVVLGDVLVAFVAAPFAVVTYFFWYQATGRIRESVRARHARGTGANGRGRFGAGRGSGRVAGGAGGRGHRRRQRRASEAHWRARRARRARAGARGGAEARSSRTRPTEAEAYRVLGVEVGADEAAVREAYRERVKDVHPDRGGDEAAFKRVTDAYERLTGG